MKSLFGNFHGESTDSSIAVLPKTEFTIYNLEDLHDPFYYGKPERLEVLEIIVVKIGEGKLAWDT
ncbi:MAG TPA: hypothetical protein VIT44_13250, partial [Cyclobacteriaceae bacterium]